MLKLVESAAKEKVRRGRGATPPSIYLIARFCPSPRFSTGIEIFTRFEMSHFKKFLKVLSNEKRCGLKLESGVNQLSAKCRRLVKESGKLA
jgi:hypothetical protein